MNFDDVMIEELLTESAAGRIRLTDWEENFLTEMDEKVEGELSDDEERKVAEIYQRYIGG